MNRQNRSERRKIQRQHAREMEKSIGHGHIRHRHTRIIASLAILSALTFGGAPFSVNASDGAPIGMSREAGSRQSEVKSKDLVAPRRDAESTSEDEDEAE